MRVALMIPCYMDMFYPRAGVATLQPKETSDALLARADRALYVAKAKGRNRVATATSNSPLDTPMRRRSDTESSRIVS